jgi:hypothetical protein
MTEIERSVRGNLYKGRMRKNGDNDKMYKRPFDDGGDCGIYIRHDRISVDIIRKCQYRIRDSGSAQRGQSVRRKTVRQTNSEKMAFKKVK